MGIHEYQSCGEMKMNKRKNHIFVSANEYLPGTKLLAVNGVVKGSVFMVVNVNKDNNILLLLMIEAPTPSYPGTGYIHSLDPDTTVRMVNVGPF